MTYLTEQKISNNEFAYMVVVKPRFHMVANGNATRSFTLGRPTRIFRIPSTIDITLFPREDSSFDLETDWDDDAQEITLPGGSLDYLIEYELFFATTDLVWHREPTDETTRFVQWQGLLLNTPTVTARADDQARGFTPSFSGQLIIEQVDYELSQHVFDSSFNDIEVDLYHVFDPLNLKPENVSLLIKGVGGNIEISNDQFRLRVFDKLKRLERNLSHISYDVFEETFNVQFSQFPVLVDNNAPGTFDVPPYIFGTIVRLLPINCDWNSTPSTSDNRIWFCGMALADYSSGSVTTPYKRFPVVTKVEIWDGSTWTTISASDYTVSASTSYGGTDGAVAAFPVFVELSATAESNASIGTFDPATDFVRVEMKGPDGHWQIKGGFYEDYQSGNSVSADLKAELPNDCPPCILLNTLLDLNILELDEVDEDSWDSVRKNLADNYITPAAYISPEASGGADDGNGGGSATVISFQPAESAKNMTQRLLNMGLLRLYVNNVGKIAVSIIEPMPDDPDHKILEAECLETLSMSVDYQDIRSFVTTQDNLISDKNGSQTTTIGGIDTEVRVHRRDDGSGVTVKAAPAISAALLLDNYQSILSYPKYRGQITLDHTWFHVNIGDIVEYFSKRIPGEKFDGTEKSAKYVVVGYEKRPDRITLTLDPQPGVEENTGWTHL